MERPTNFYRIWHSPRVGSSLLCQLLEDTGLAGKPGEHVALHGQNTLRERYSIHDYYQLRNKVWELGTGENGVFGIKLSYHKHFSHQIIQDLALAKGVSFPDCHEEIWEDFFPNSKNIILTRLDKVAQSVSWWKAIQDNEWHLTNGQKRKTSNDFYDDKYDADALSHLFRETMLREAATIDYLKKNHLAFKTIAYEDLIADPLRILNEVLLYLGLIDQVLENVPKMKYQKTSNTQNEQWIEKFREELQKGMEKKVW
jgi:LPS sulfotransferase NodH